MSVDIGRLRFDNCDMHVYVGTFIIAFATLAMEVAMTRILSVITWYHLAFFAISTAMLGMTAGATTVYLAPRWFLPEKSDRSCALACLAFALAAPVSLTVLCLLPLNLFISVMNLAALVAATAVCAIPFYFSGIAITTVLTKSTLPIGKLYAADLIGASAGSLVVLVGLECLDAPSLMIACGSLGLVACLSFASSLLTRKAAIGLVCVFAAMSFVVYVNSSSPRGIRPVVVKGKLSDPSKIFLEKWNSLSRVVVNPETLGKPQLWGPSPKARFASPIKQHFMSIDGAAGTTIRRFSSLEDIRHLRFDVTNAAYYLRGSGGTCVIGVGGGKDILGAFLFGHQRILGLDVNPIFIDLLQNDFREFAGIDAITGLELVADEARSYLSRTESEFEVIQMSLIDTWAATGAGAFSLSENALYTIEAWRIFMERLTPTGIFTVSRWYNPLDLGETGRIVSLATATLLDAGVTDPSKQIAMVTTGRVSTLLLGNSPFSDEDISVLTWLKAEFSFGLPIVPNVEPEHELLRRIVSCDSRESLTAVIEDQPLNYAPPTDDSPYFFNILKPSSLAASFSAVPGVVQGNLMATLTLAGLLVSLAVVAGFTVLVPLMARVFLGNTEQPTVGRMLPAAIYFSAIGGGFMIVEIALIQKMTLILGHPIYALGVILSTLIASTGIGSYLSERIDPRPMNMVVLPLLVAGAIMLLPFAMSAIATHMISEGIVAKAGVAVATIAPCGILLGFFFPLGMRRVRSVNSAATPWYWALNGIFGVLCSAIAVFISINFGISTNFKVAAVCYVLLPPCAILMGHKANLENPR